MSIFIVIFLVCNGSVLFLLSKCLLLKKEMNNLDVFYTLAGVVINLGILRFTFSLLESLRFIDYFLVIAIAFSGLFALWKLTGLLLIPTWKSKKLRLSDEEKLDLSIAKRDKHLLLILFIISFISTGMLLLIN